MAGIAAGTVLCFLLTLNEFGILLVLGSARLVTLPVAIYSSATVDLDLPTASAGAVVMLALSLALYAVYRRVNRRATEGTMSAEFRIGQAVPRHQIGWGDTVLKHASRAALALAAFACFWLFVLPVIVVALSSVSTQWSGTILPAGYSLRWFERLGSPEYDALLTSLEIGFGVSAVGTVLGCGSRWRSKGDRRGLGAVVDALVMVPNGVPSVVLAAVLIAYHQKPVDLSSRRRSSCSCSSR